MFAIIVVWHFIFRDNALKVKVDFHLSAKSHARWIKSNFETFRLIFLGHKNVNNSCGTESTFNLKEGRSQSFSRSRWLNTPYIDRYHGSFTKNIHSQLYTTEIPESHHLIIHKLFEYIHTMYKYIDNTIIRFSSALNRLLHN